MLTFGIERWDAWSAGIRDEQSWEQNLRENSTTGHSVSLNNANHLYLKPRQKRRLSAISKITLDVAFGALGNEAQLSSIFASRRGEVQRMAGLLQSICKGEELSPMAFSLSVHNTTSGLFSIQSGNQAPSTAIAAGYDTLSSALIEACSQLACGQDKLLLVVSEDIMPEVYATFADPNEQPVAAAFLLTNKSQYALEIKTADQSNQQKLSTDQQVKQLLSAVIYNQPGVIQGERLLCRILPQ